MKSRAGQGPAGALPGEYRRRRENTEGRWTVARRNRDLVFRSKRFVPTIGFAEQHKIKDLRVFRADPKERNFGVGTQGSNLVLDTVVHVFADLGHVVVVFA